MTWKRVFLALCVAVFTVTSVQADEVVENLEKAKKHYEEKNYDQMTKLLNATVAKVKAMQKKELEAFLPEPLDGYTFEYIQTPPVPAFMEGLGMQVDGKYSKSGNEITLSILLNSPLNAAYAKFLNSPAEREKAPQTQPYEFKGYKGTRREDANSSEITLIVTDTILVIAREKGPVTGDLEKQVQKIRFDDLKKTFD